MASRDLSRPFTCAAEGRFYAAGPAGGRPEPAGDDSPTARDADGTLAPEPLPGGVEGEPESETRPRERDSGRSDGVEDLKRMEENAEDGRE